MHSSMARSLTRGFLAVLLLVVACATNPVTGKRELSFMSEDQELALGREADPQIVATYGLYDDPELAAYVDEIGQKLARVSHRPDMQFTFRVLDSPVINAFALPGGFIYLTRGILAHMNDEAELAVVLGHEIGHVTARHGAKQYSRATLASLGLGLGSAFVPEVARFGQLAETALGLLFLKYGRDDEHQSDELGVAYSLRAGYDPEVGAKFFEVLDRQQQESGQALPDWLSTHPPPANRVARTRDLSQQAKLQQQGGPYRVGEATHKSRIAGVVFGDDPRQGFLEGRTFKHPTMEFQLTFPQGWAVQNTPSAVLSAEPNRKAQMQLTLENSEGTAPEVYALRLAQKAEATIVQESRERIGNYAAYVATLSVSSQGGSVPVQLGCIQRQTGGPIYQIVGVAAENFATWQDDFLATIRSFKRLTDARALDIEPNRVRVELVQRRGSFESVLARYKDVPVSTATLALLNNLHAESQLEQGFRLKVVRGSFVAQHSAQ